MKDDGGRVVRIWGPLLLVAVLVVVFRFADTSGTDSGNVLPAMRSPGSAAAPSVPGGTTRSPDGGFNPLSAYPVAPYAGSPVPNPGAPWGCPPWAGYGWPQPFPRPGEHSGRYWGRGAAEWGAPIGEYGPDTRVDPYWWVAAGEVDR